MSISWQFCPVVMPVMYKMSGSTTENECSCCPKIYSNM